MCHVGHESTFWHVWGGDGVGYVDLMQKSRSNRLRGAAVSWGASARGEYDTWLVYTRVFYYMYG